MKTGEITGKPHLSMEWLPKNYLKLTIEQGIAIDMEHYLGGALKEPKNANVHHLQEVIEGWKTNQIKWVKLTAEECECQQKDLSELSIEATNNNQEQPPSPRNSNIHTMYLAR